MTPAILSIPRVPARAGAADILAALNEAGVVVIEGATSLEQTEAAAFELEPFLRRTPHGEGVFYGKATRRNGAVVKKAPATIAWAIHDLILDVMDGVLKPNCDCIQLNATQAIRIEPGEKAQFLHRDDALFPIVAKVSPPIEFMVNCMWALTPFTPENGATRAIPGSHRWALDREPQVGEASPCCMEPGDVTLFLGSTQHGGGANRTAAHRTGVVFSYSLGWLRQTENCSHAVPWEDARALPRRLQELLGYQVHRPSLGWVEGVHPIDWYEGSRPEVGPARDMLTPQQLHMVGEVAADPEKFAAYVN